MTDIAVIRTCHTCHEIKSLDRAGSVDILNHAGVFTYETADSTVGSVGYGGATVAIRNHSTDVVTYETAGAHRVCIHLTGGITSLDCAGCGVAYEYTCIGGAGDIGVDYAEIFDFTIFKATEKAHSFTDSCLRQPEIGNRMACAIEVTAERRTFGGDRSVKRRRIYVGIETEINIFGPVN